MSQITMARLAKEQKKLLSDPIQNCIIKRKGNLHFHFCFWGMKGDYEGGYYHGVLELPENYPFAPPNLKFFTPSGRFSTDVLICTSFTSYHKETWSTAWTVQKLVIGTISFFQVDQLGIGANILSSEVKRKLAKQSLGWNLKNQIFQQLFKNQLDLPKNDIIELESQQSTKTKQIQENKQQIQESKQQIQEKQQRQVQKQYQKSVQKSTDRKILYFLGIGLVGVVVIGLISRNASKKE